MHNHKFNPHRFAPEQQARVLAERNLHLLSAIEDTLQVLHADTAIVNAVELAYKEMHNHVRGIDGVIDADGKLDSALDKASDLCAHIYHATKERHQAAISDAHLIADSGVIEAYEHYIEAMRNLHGTIETLRHWVGDHDASLEPATSPVFNDVDSLFDSLLHNRTPTHA